MISRFSGISYILTGVITMSVASMAAQSDMELKVREAVLQFMKSGDERNSGLADKVLHENFQLLYHVNKELITSGKDEYIRLLSKGVIGGESRKEMFKSVEITNNIAHVHVVFESTVSLFDQYINLVKVDGTWKIASIVLDFSKK